VFCGSNACVENYRMSGVIQEKVCYYPRYSGIYKEVYQEERRVYQKPKDARASLVIPHKEKKFAQTGD
jgi:hypothetical protein